MIPLSDHNPLSRRAFLVPILIAANVIIFFFIQPSFSGRDGDNKQLSNLKYNLCNAAIPFEVINQAPLADAADSELDQNGRAFADFQRQECPEKSVPISILASLFFHGGLLHLAGNMLFLWVFGNNIEDRLGTFRFALFYLLAGVGATYAQSFVTPDSPIPLIGASGAIAGVLGAYLVLYPRARVRTLIMFFIITIVDLPAALVLALWFGLQLLNGFGPGSTTDSVAYFAHIGGFVAGMLLLGIFRPRPLRSRGQSFNP